MTTGEGVRKKGIGGMRWIFRYGRGPGSLARGMRLERGHRVPNAAQKQADIYAIDQIEVKWHKATSMKDVDLIMSLFAPDATATFGTTNLTGTGEIRDFFVNKMGPFQPENNWVSDTPAYKIRVTVNGEEVMGVIEEFHAAMGTLILQYEATVGWFAGDGLMVWFNDPIPCPDPPARAVRMAADMRAALTALLPKWRRRGHELDFSAGIALGYATLGRIGFDGRYDYGAVGSVMNLASRLCDEAGGSQILVSERVLAEVEELVEAEPAGALTLKGFMKPVTAFTIIDVKSETEHVQPPSASAQTFGEAIP
jgi:class 3 adenylate cyclase